MSRIDEIKPQKSKISVSIDREVHARIIAIATEKNVPVCSVTLALLLDALDDYESKK